MNRNRAHLPQNLDAAHRRRRAERRGAFASASARRGFTLVHAITYCGAMAAVLAAIALSLHSLARARERLQAAQQLQDMWLRLSWQFRIDCHAALRADWDRVSEAPQPSAANSDMAEPQALSSVDHPPAPRGKASQPAESRRSPPRDPWAGPRLTLTLPRQTRVHYILQSRRLLRREESPDATRVESFALPQAAQVQWSWRDQARQQLQLELRPDSQANTPTDGATWSRVRIVMAQLNRDQRLWEPQP